MLPKVSQDNVLSSYFLTIEGNTGQLRGTVSLKFFCCVDPHRGLLKIVLECLRIWSLSWMSQ